MTKEEFEKLPPRLQRAMATRALAWFCVHCTINPLVTQGEESDVMKIVVGKFMNAEGATDLTERYQGMIETFECDLSLAADQPDKGWLEDLQEKIESHNERLFADIDLIRELSFGIRNGQIKIIQEKK